MDTPQRPKPDRKGFQEFVRSQRKLHAAGVLSPAPIFEVKVDETQEMSSSFLTGGENEPLITIKCGEGQNIEELHNVPLNALVGASHWFYQLFKTKGKDQWADSRSDSIYLPSLTPSITRQIVEFATLERRVNPTVSFLVKPPTEGKWDQTLDLTERTTFQFTVGPEAALDLCHAALFLEMPALLDVSCRMVAYFIDFLPTVAGMDRNLVTKILSHVLPLKLALYERYPEFESFQSSLTPSWTQFCAAAGLETTELDTEWSWHKFGYFAISASEPVTPRELYVYNALRKELGKLATEYKIEKGIQTLQLAAQAETGTPPASPPRSNTPMQQSRGWKLDADGVWQRDVSGLSLVDTEWNADGTKIVGALADLEELEVHVRSVTLRFPLDRNIIISMRHLETLQIRDTLLWSQLAEVLPELPNLRHLLVDYAIVTSSAFSLPEVIYHMHDQDRSNYLVPLEWKPNQPQEEPFTTTLEELGPGALKSTLFAALALLQASSKLPFLKSFQFSNVEYDGAWNHGGRMWDYVLAPHWRQTDGVFYPSLESLSLYGSGLSGTALSVVLEVFQDCPIQLLDIGANQLTLLSDTNWRPFARWSHLKHLFITQCSMRRITSGISPGELASFVPTTIETLVLDGTGDQGPGFFNGLAANGATQLKSIILPSGASYDIMDNISVNAQVLGHSLQVLDFGSLVRANDSSISQIDRLLQHVPNLLELKLGIAAFTDLGFERLLLYTLSNPTCRTNVSWVPNARFPIPRRIIPTAATQ